jgi:hypothetical protein
MFEAIAYFREKRSETITIGFKEADYFGERVARVAIWVFVQTWNLGYKGLCNLLTSQSLIL